MVICEKKAEKKTLLTGVVREKEGSGSSRISYVTTASIVHTVMTKYAIMGGRGLTPTH